MIYNTYTVILYSHGGVLLAKVDHIALRSVFSAIFLQSEGYIHCMDASKKLIINTLWCKGCGICAAFCPKGALEIVEEKVRLKENGACILCGQCELRCPDYAIYIETAKEKED